jgi:hypothetical protein
LALDWRRCCGDSWISQLAYVVIQANQFLIIAFQFGYWHRPLAPPVWLSTFTHLHFDSSLLQLASQPYMFPIPNSIDPVLPYALGLFMTSQITIA